MTAGDDDNPVDPNPPPPPPPPPGDLVLSVVGGGQNVEDRFSSDLWVHGAHAYTGTWGFRGGNSGNAVKIWRLDASGAPALIDSIIIDGITTVSDLEVSDDGQVLLASAEGVEQPGLYLYSLADPERPVLLDSEAVGTGLHTATFGLIEGRRYVFAARNPADPALMIYDVTDPATIALAASVPIPPDYGIHDTFVREGLAFVFAWNTGVIIYDVGNGIRGGTPTQPVEVSRLVTSDNGVAGGPAVHNGWWFHNPVTQEKRYLFIGQEGPATVGNRGERRHPRRGRLGPHRSPRGRVLSPRRRGHPQFLDGRGPPDPLRRLLQCRGRRDRCLRRAARRSGGPADQPDSARRDERRPLPGAFSSRASRSTRATWCQGSGN